MKTFWVKLANRVLFSLLIVLSLGNASSAQGNTGTLSIEKERQEALKEFNITEVPNLDAIRSATNDLFAKPIEEQSTESLKTLAKLANQAANLVNYIYEEYDDFYRENYEYDSLRKDVIGPAREHREVVNEFVDIRNKAYFNLGIIARDAGKTMEAFLYFRDAFRLSGFNCWETVPNKCMRRKAEQELQKLLELSHIKAYYGSRYR